MLDPVLPSYDIREYHEVAVDASPEDAMAAALALRAASDPIVATLFWLRGVWGPLTHQGPLPLGGGLSLRAFFSRLGLERVVETDRAFVGVGDLFGVRIAFGMWAEESGERGARLATETRVHALNPAARWRFRLYWLVVGPFSALIRRRWLSAARRAAERRD